MSKTALTLAILFVILVTTQAVFFNNLVLFNVAVPLVFIYLLIILPVTLSDMVSYTIGFVTGLAVDILSDTPGINALSSTLLVAVRKPVFHLYVSADIDLADQCPSPRNIGITAFLKYALTMSVIYCALVFSIEACMVFNLRLYLMRVLCSSVFTFVIIYAIASLTGHRREKRL